jgi:GNAT superfamily N-acetyltransferase
MAKPSDVPHLAVIDHLASTDSARVALIESATTAATCLLAEFNGQLAGYGILTYSFFGNGLIELLYVRQNLRRKGIGRAILVRLEELCTTAKLFVTTNLSNQPMRSLILSRDFLPSGHIDNLDDDDQELIFFKKLDRREA